MLQNKNLKAREVEKRKMSCYSKQILDLFYNVQYTGRIIKPEAIGRAGSEKEGTVIEFSWRVQDGRILDARFRTFGDVNAIAISSVITSMVIGKSIDEVLLLRAEDILEHLQDNKPTYLYLIDLALSAIANTYENYLKKNGTIIKSKNKFVEEFKQNLNKIEQGETVENLQDNLDLSNISQEIDEENDYLNNLKTYEGTLNDEFENNDLFSQMYSKTTSVEQTKQGRGRPRKERSIDEMEEQLHKVSRGRGRPKKNVGDNELQEEQQVKRGRGRPRKEIEQDLDENNKAILTEEQTIQANSSESGNALRGRGRPRKEKTVGISEENTIKRGRGRPKKDTAIVIQNIKPVSNLQNKDEIIPLKNNNDEESVSFKNNVVTTNAFAPAQNKYGVGINTLSTKKVTTIQTVTTSYEQTKEVISNPIKQTNLKDKLDSKEIKFEKHSTIFNSKINLPNLDEFDNNIKFKDIDDEIDVTKEEPANIENKQAKNDDKITVSLEEMLKQEDKEPEEIRPLSENIDKILSNGGSIEDALKALMEED